MQNGGFKLPERRFLINLAPADLHESGSSFDLAIAIALLVRLRNVRALLSDTLILGELWLCGRSQQTAKRASNLQPSAATTC